MFYMVQGFPATVPSYSDLMAHILLKKVGEKYDPSNPFMVLNFFIVPLITTLGRLWFLAYGTRVSGTILWSAIPFELLFTLGPLLITTHHYYPLTL